MIDEVGIIDERHDTVKIHHCEGPSVLFLTPTLHSRKDQPLYLPLGTWVSHLGVGAFHTTCSDHGCIDFAHKQADALVFEANGRKVSIEIFTIPKVDSSDPKRGVQTFQTSCFTRKICSTRSAKCRH
jgi:hypothetical protein